MPIFGILTDGDTFHFLLFQRPQLKRCTGSSISVAVGFNGGWKRALTLKRLEDCERPEEFLRSLRPICEVIYSVLIGAFIQLIEAHYQCSLRRTQPGDKKRKSTDNWYNSKALGKRALAIAEDGARVAGTGKISAANQAAESASVPNRPGQAGLSGGF
ncbi:hypothetical protein BDD12DRAFT_895277 [Trichophaea hybrida]|nr:hypothetical protein BDD12DRAFT_895277 [Trichophaea hybrida]